MFVLLCSGVFITLQKIQPTGHEDVYHHQDLLSGSMGCILSDRREEHNFRQHRWLPSSTEEFIMNVSRGAGLILEGELL